MAVEIERKFLIRHAGWRDAIVRSSHMRQGYFQQAGKASFRVRIAEKQANLNIKSATLGISRQEYEYPIPLPDAHTLLDTLCEHPLIEKTRYWVQNAGQLWEVDVFTGENDGLVVAELELAHEEAPFDRPDWLGDEVSDKPRYYNACLVQQPFCRWPSAWRGAVTPACPES